MTSLVTLFLAILLFQKFGIEKNIVDKNLDRVEKLIEEIRKIRFVITGESFAIQFIPIKNSNYDLPQHYLDKPIILTPETAEKIESTLSLSSDPFLPKQISAALEDLSFVGGKVVSRSELLSDRFAKLDLYPKTNSIPSGKNSVIDYVIYNKFGVEDRTTSVTTYISKWEEVIFEINSWIEKNSSLKGYVNLIATNN